MCRSDGDDGEVVAGQEHRSTSSEHTTRPHGVARCQKEHGIRRKDKRTLKQSLSARGTENKNEDMAQACETTYARSIAIRSCDNIDLTLDVLLAVLAERHAERKTAKAVVDWGIATRSQGAGGSPTGLHVGAMWTGPGWG